MKRLIYGVGLSGSESGYKVSKDCYYECWRSMLRRCYSKEFHDKHPTYIGCTVCDEWLDFANFKSWMEKQDWQGKDLDKDLLIRGNKIYSENTCVFVDHKINSFTNDCGSRKGEFPSGVYFHKRPGLFMASCNNPFSKKREFLGYFKCPDEAHLAWKSRKHEFACKFSELVNDYRLANALRLIYT